MTGSSEQRSRSQHSADGRQLHEGLHAATGRLPDDVSTPRSVAVLPPPPEALPRDQYDERQVARVEALMSRAITSPSLIGHLLGITDTRQIKRYTARVHARWDALGGPKDHRRARGESISRLHEIADRLWLIACNGEDPRAQTVALDRLLQIDERLSLLAGLTPTAIEQLDKVTEDNEIVMRLAKQTNLSADARRLAQIIMERREAAETATLEVEKVHLHREGSSGESRTPSVRRRTRSNLRTNTAALGADPGRHKGPPASDSIDGIVHTNQPADAS